MNWRGRSVVYHHGALSDFEYLSWGYYSHGNSVYRPAVLCGSNAYIRLKWIEDADDYYAAQVELMKDRAPA